ncbi:hypothetical protein AYR46_16590 [Sphingobium yanoikuyae]|nr:hypothetical protein AYR46_16590 [Sphingobium yanoikuyae]
MRTPLQLPLKWLLAGMLLFFSRAVEATWHPLRENVLPTLVVVLGLAQVAREMYSPVLSVALLRVAPLRSRQPPGGCGFTVALERSWRRRLDRSVFLRGSFCRLFLR